MTAVEIIQDQIKVDEKELRSDLVKALTAVIKRRFDRAAELRHMIGLRDLPRNPNESDFYGVFMVMEALIESSDFGRILTDLGYDGPTGLAWLNYASGKAPTRDGKRVLELIFDRVFEEFCGGNLIWWVHRLAESADEIVDLAIEQAEILGSELEVTLKTPLGNIPRLPARFQNSIKNSFPLLGDVLLVGEAEIMKEPNVGPKSLDEFKQIIARYGYRLTTASEPDSIPELRAFYDWRQQNPVR